MSTSNVSATGPILVAHRGISLYQVPENIEDAIEEALKADFEVETDVQRSTDGKLFLYHDDFIPGPNDFEMNGGGFYLPSGKKPVTECTWTELQGTIFDKARHEAVLSKQAGKKVKLRYKATPKIATLEELFVLMERYPKCKVHLEIKRPSETATYNDGVEEEIAGKIADRGLLKNVVLISFNESSLRNTRKANPNIAIGADVYDRQVSVQEASRLRDEIGISYWNPPFKQTTGDLVRAVEKLGVKVAPWPWGEDIDLELDKIGRLYRMGLTNIMTNVAKEAKRKITRS